MSVNKKCEKSCFLAWACKTPCMPFMNTKCRAECADQVLAALIDIMQADEAFDRAHDPECWDGPYPNLEQIEAINAAQDLIMSAHRVAETAIAAATQPARGVAYCAGCDNTFPLEELRKHDDGVFCANCRPFDTHGRYIGAQHAAVESVVTDHAEKPIAYMPKKTPAPDSPLERIADRLKQLSDSVMVSEIAEQLRNGFEPEFERFAIQRLVDEWVPNLEKRCTTAGEKIQAIRALFTSQDMSMHGDPYETGFKSAVERILEAKE